MLKEMMRLGEEMGPWKGCDLWRRCYLGKICVPKDGQWLGKGGSVEIMGLGTRCSMRRRCVLGENMGLERMRA
jgi:hypothetical protein